jgi:hypothetical protein
MINALLLYVSLLLAATAAISGEIILADRLLSGPELAQFAEVWP